ncbi:hypothetical protein JD82_02788 [Prauserella rugosa]|uniref:Uncharacterized protein n=1 Tax=Prauserella rugosa TaxID=43354 RepID=A0A660CGE7_9PSEU|nr:hypothetical protein JD82_02788 [Prauserella rugosa]
MITLPLLELPSETTARLQRVANAHGMTVEALLAEIIKEYVEAGWTR